MIDLFAIGLTHGLIAIACWRILQRRDLDVTDESGAVEANPGRTGKRRRA